MFKISIPTDVTSVKEFMFPKMKSDTGKFLLKTTIKIGRTDKNFNVRN